MEESMLMVEIVLDVGWGGGWCDVDSVVDSGWIVRL